MHETSLSASLSRARRYAPLATFLAIMLCRSAAGSTDGPSAYTPFAPAQVTAADYDRAARLFTAQAASLVRNAEVHPNWIGGKGEFWYRRVTASGSEFRLVNPSSKRNSPAFDHARVATALADAGRPVRADALPFSAFAFDDSRTLIRFEAWGEAWQCRLDRYTCGREPQQRTATTDAVVSPGGTHAVFRRNRNLWIRDLRSGEEHALTTDGEKFNEYAWLSGNSQAYVAAERMAITVAPRALWSPDSTQVLTHRTDERSVAATSAWQSAPADSLRPKVWEYHQSFPGEAHEPQTSYVIFNVATGQRIDVPDLPNPGAFYAPVGGAWSWWSKDSRSVFFLSHDRYFKGVGLYQLSARDGRIRLILEEASQTYVGMSGSFQPAGQVTSRTLRESDGGELLWFSERDGWGHLYRYDLKTGKLKNRVTSGSWAVYGIAYVDEPRGTIYFLGAGKEPHENPYQTHLYRVNLDGGGLRLLTPEDANHSVTFSPDGRYFVDAYSRPDTCPVSVLRLSADGRILMPLEFADMTSLEAGGWRWPLPFVVKARDGITDLYGTMFRPSHLQAGKKYPVIDLVYPAPWHIFPDVASFNAPSGGLNQYWIRQGLAELGFIVINLQGFGTPGRGKQFLDRSYGHLEDGPGLPDHVVGITELAATHPEIDLDRVGVLGHSSGGYGALLALLTYSEFFKAGVASAPAVDMRGLLGIVLEGYQGPPGANQENYDAVVLARLAGNLRGHLLLTYSDLDENASAATTMQFIQALNRENRDYDLVVFPNRNHSYSTDPYYLRRVSDFFVRNLMGSEPPIRYAFPARVDESQ
jgi:dipeptidyl-peptidase-4